jgi:hypothetical protein
LHDYGISLGNHQAQNTHHKFMVLDFMDAPKLANAAWLGAQAGSLASQTFESFDHIGMIVTTARIIVELGAPKWRCNGSNSLDFRSVNF